MLVASRDLPFLETRMEESTSLVLSLEHLSVINGLEKVIGQESRHAVSPAQCRVKLRVSEIVEHREQ